MAIVDFGSASVDMRQVDDYGISQLENLADFLAGFVIVREEVLHNT